MKNMFLGLVLCFMTSRVFAADIEASLSRQTVPLGEVVMLNLSVEGGVNGQPDLSVLEPDFKVYSTSVSRKNFNINGQASTWTTWQVGLAPLKAGELQIPSIQIGTDKSEPLSLEVVAAGTPIEDEQTENVARYNLTAEITNMPQKYYVQQQLNYQVTLIDAGGLQGGEPVFENNGNEWLIINLGQPKISVVNEKGKSWREIKYNYALFAQKSGNLKIPAVNFEGYAFSEPSAASLNLNMNGFFGISMPSLFDIEQPVHLRAPEKEINVLSVPQTYQNKWWLPAKNVTLSATFTDTNLSFKQGEAINRKISIKAEGLSAAQLPDLETQSQPDLKQYKGEYQTQDMLKNGVVIGEKTLTITYVPEKSGKVFLPEIKLMWYNVGTEQIETAILPAEEINVAPNPLLEAAFNQPTTVEPTIETPQEQPKEQTVKPQDTDNVWLPYVAAFLAFLAGLFLSAFLFKKTEKPYCDTRRYPKFIIEKAYAADFRSLRDALISWATGHYPQKSITNLKDVATAAGDKAFEEQINIILNKLYNPQDDTDFNAKVFVDIFHKVNKKKQNKKQTDPLPPLYD